MFKPLLALSSFSLLLSFLTITITTSKDDCCCCCIMAYSPLLSTSFTRTETITTRTTRTFGGGAGAAGRFVVHNNNNKISLDGGGRYWNSGQLHMSIPTPIDTVSSGIASICRLPGGVDVNTASFTMIPMNERPKIQRLYDIENNRSCRKVRERITELDLSVDCVIPAARNSRVYVDPKYKYYYSMDDEVDGEQNNKDKKKMMMILPRMIIEEEGENEKEIILSGEDEIMSYLDEKFMTDTERRGDDDELLTEEEEIQKLGKQALNVLREVGNYVANVCRIGRGTKVISAASAASSTRDGIIIPRPEKPLILYSYEGNQFCRLVREVLTELDIPYELRSCGKNSARREELGKITVDGTTQCPYIIDPNTDTAMKDSSDIIRYLYKTYALWTPPNELLQWISDVLLPFIKPIFTVLTPIQAGSYRENKIQYQQEIKTAKKKIQNQILSTTTTSNNVVVYTYALSPFSIETKALLNNLNVDYNEISLGSEWIPGFINKDDGSQMRAALFEMTGQSSLPHIFVGGRSIGGLFSGTPGLIPALEQGTFLNMVQQQQQDAVVATTETTTTTETEDEPSSSSSEDVVTTKEEEEEEVQIIPEEETAAASSVFE